MSPWHLMGKVEEPGRKSEAHSFRCKHVDLVAKGLVGKGDANQQKYQDPYCVTYAGCNVLRCLEIDCTFEVCAKILTQRCHPDKLQAFWNKYKVKCHKKGFCWLLSCIWRAQNHLGVYLFVVELEFPSETMRHALCYSSLHSLLMDDNGLWRVHGRVGKKAKFEKSNKPSGSVLPRSTQRIGE